MSFEQKKCTSLAMRPISPSALCDESDSSGVRMWGLTAQTPSAKSEGIIWLTSLPNEQK